MMKFEFENPDLHIHSSFSDGSESPKELLDNIRKSKIDIFALTDHDSYLGCDEVRKYLRADDPFFISGVELSCKDDMGKYHILGYGYDVNKPAVVQAINKTHKMRMEKAKNRLVFLSKEYGFIFNDADKEYLLSLKNPGKPHFAEMMLKYGYIEKKEQGFEILSHYRGNEGGLSAEEAIDAILASNGIPVLAHGILGDGSKQLSKEKISCVVSKFKKFGLMGLECYYSGYSEEQESIMIELSEKNNLLITAGSDYHGSKKTVKLGDTHNPDKEKMKKYYKAVTLIANE